MKKGIMAFFIFSIVGLGFAQDITQPTPPTEPTGPVVPGASERVEYPIIPIDGDVEIN